MKRQAACLQWLVSGAISTNNSLPPMHVASLKQSLYLEFQVFCLFWINVSDLTASDFHLMYAF